MFWIYVFCHQNLLCLKSDYIVKTEEGISGWINLLDDELSHNIKRFLRRALAEFRQIFIKFQLITAELMQMEAALKMGMASYRYWLIYNIYKLTLKSCEVRRSDFPARLFDSIEIEIRIRSQVNADEGHNRLIQLEQRNIHN